MINTRLKLKKFKKIYEEVIFNNFEFVNYFVGENGSGKTSILNALSYLNDPVNSRHFFGPESIVDFEFNGQNQSICWNKENPNKVENHIVNLSPKIFIYAFNTSEKGANGISGKGDSTVRLAAGSTVGLADLNNFLKEINHNELTAKKFVDQEDPFNQDNGKLIYESDSGLINPSLLADGHTALYNFKKNLKTWSTKFNNYLNLIIIEEIENWLHPNLQKEIPVILNDLLTNLNEYQANRTFFFISTHSPFIISSSTKFKRQKVYPLQNGKPVEIDFQKNTWIETNISYGYSGSECVYIVNQMLGVEITDFGYPENYCILEEYSLQIILDDARKKGIIKNIQFVSASGISKATDLSETIYELEKLNTLIKCNPYYYDKYLLIIDNTGEIKDNKLKIRLNNIRSRINNRYIELNLHSLENYYSNIDKEIEDIAKDEINKLDTKNMGICKAKFARLISDKIKNKKTFSKLFNGELDILLKE